ncbi:MAG: glycosyltransferase family 4 protein [Phycisphaerales bacterium]|nr:glycosyltransferase family 4 protein [Phycisphaerales bacterium]
MSQAALSPAGHAESAESRPAVAIVTNSLTPYRVAVHRRIVRELPQIRLYTVVTHDAADQPWTLNAGDIGVVKFAAEGEKVDDVRPLRYAPAHYAKARRITEWARTTGVRAIVVSGYNDLTRLELIRWAYRAGIPVFLASDSNSRCDRATGAKRAVKNSLIRWIIRRCAGLLPHGSLGAEYFTSRGADRSKIFYFPSEPDYDLILNLPQSAIDKAMADLRLDPSRRRVVLCGRLIGLKRIDLAIDAFAAIAAERPEWDLVFIGDGPLKAELQARVPEHLKSRVIWAGFIGDQSVISAVYRRSDVALLVSDYDAWGLVVNEAMTAGMAVITSDVVGASAELVKEGINGRVVPRGDVKALTAAIREVTDPANIDRYKAASPPIIAEWRRVGDPVKGLQRALASAGVLPG